jgi:hypothetical protein
LIDAPDAVPGPLFVNVTVHENGLPALTVCVAGVFVIPIVGQPTVVVAVAGFGAVPFPSVTVAVLVYSWHEPEVVPLITCTLLLAPAAKLAAENTSTWFGTEPVIDQPVTGVSIDQDTPVPAGSGSFTATFCAGP